MILQMKLDDQLEFLMKVEMEKLFLMDMQDGLKQILCTQNNLIIVLSLLLLKLEILLQTNLNALADLFVIFF